METKKSKEVQPVVESKVDKLDNKTVSALRRRWALVIGLALAATFGGSCDGCDGSLRGCGKEMVGCSCVDTGPRGSNNNKKELRTDFND